MCKYCQDNNIFGNGVRIDNNTTGHEHFLKYEKTKYYFLTTIDGVYTYSTPLSYCPFCGEELKAREGDYDNIFDYLKSIQNDPVLFETTIDAAKSYQENHMDPTAYMEDIIKNVDYQLNPEKYEPTPEEPEVPEVDPVEPTEPETEPEETPTEPETKPENGDDDPSCGKIEDLVNGNEDDKIKEEEKKKEEELNQYLESTEPETEPEKGDDPTCGKIEDLPSGEESTEEK